MRRLALVIVALAPCLFGYVRLTTQEANPVSLQRIDNTGIQFYLNNLVIPGAQSSASGKTVTVISAKSNPLQAIGLAQGAWNNVATASVKFLAVQSTTKTHDSNDCTNVISIGASASDLSALNGAIAITINASATGSGVLCSQNVVDGDIVDSDILLNPSFSFSTDYSTGVDLQATMTHEFGHSLSANHTGVLGATMFQYSSINNTALINQRYLSTDDLTFVNGAYPAAGSAAQPLGTISGAVTAGGAAVPYALLTMIDTTQGLTLGGLANASGNYSVQVPPGSYMVYAEPFALVQAGNLYFTVAQAALASSVIFQPTFAGGNASPATAAVTANTTATANIAVAAGATTLATPFVAVVPTGTTVPASALSTFVGPVSIPSGQTVDLGFLGSGYDATVTYRVLGAGVSVTKVAVDPTQQFTVNGAPLTLVRVTVSIPASQNANIATIFISKGGASLSYSGVLVITPPTPAFIPASLVSAASDVSVPLGIGSVSPGGIYSLYAAKGTSNLGPATPVVNAGYDPYGFLSGRLANVSVTFDGIAAPAFFVYGGQINLQVPFEVAGKTSTNVVVNYYGSMNAPVAVPVLSEQPAFFTITPEGTDSIIVNQSGSLNSSANPAPRSSYVTAYGTGLGNVTGLVTGQGAAVESTLNYTCTIGSTVSTGSFNFVGWTPTAVGLAQFTFQVPAGVTANSTQTLKCTDTTTGVSTPPGTLYVGN